MSLVSSNTLYSWEWSWVMIKVYINFLLEFFWIELVQQQSLCKDFGCGLIRGFAFVEKDSISVFFQFGEIFIEIWVIERNSRIFILLNLVRIIPVKTRSSKLEKNFLKVRLDFIKHCLEIINFFFLHIDILLDFLPFFLIVWGSCQESLLFSVLYFQIFIFQAQSFICVCDGINFLVQDIYISQEVVILFLSLNKSILDFFNVCQPCCLFDCVECLIDNFHVSLIIVNEFHLLFVVNN